MNKNLIILALASCSNLLANPSQAQSQNQIMFAGQVLPQCSSTMIDGQSVTEDSNNLSINNHPAIVNKAPISGFSARFTLASNRGLITTVCNTSSTLSVSIDRTASTINDPSTKIHFMAGGTGIYTNAHQNSDYQETASFSTNGVTSAIGDTAEMETNSSTTQNLGDSIVVCASLTPQ